MKKLKSRKPSERVNVYLKKQDKRKRRKKIFFMSLVCLVASMAFLFKAPMFGIKGFTVTGNKMVKKEGVLNKNFVGGKNIFLLDTNQVENEILKNPYIQTAKVTRSLPDQIAIKVTERKMFYKIKLEDEVYILNNALYIMDIVKEDKDLALVELKGVKVDSKEVGERITKNDELAKVALNVAENLIDKNKESIFTLVDLTDVGDVSIYKDKVEIILGQPKELDEKYKQAMEILNSKEINLKAGYIDISVPSQPVIKAMEEEVVEDQSKENNAQSTKGESENEKAYGNKDTIDKNVQGEQIQEREKESDIKKSSEEVEGDNKNVSEQSEVPLEENKTEIVEPNNSTHDTDEINTHL